MAKKTAFALILILVLTVVGLVACTPAAVAIEKIELTSQPKTVYEMGDSIDFGEAKLMVYYKNGSSQIIEITENATVSGFRRNVAGEQIITVRYSEEFSYAETAFAVMVNRPKAVLSKTAVFPNVDYIQGRPLDFEGAYATVVYDKKYGDENITETFPLSSDNLVSGGTAEAGTQTLEFLLYNDGEKDVTVSTEITVYDSEVRSVSLATLDAAPTKTAYALGTALDLSGLKLRLFMNTEVDATVDTVIKTADGGFTLETYGGTITALDVDGEEFDSSFENAADLYIYFRETETSAVLKTAGTITVKAVEKMPSEVADELPTYEPGVPSQVVNRPLDFGTTVMTVTFNDQTEARYNLGDYDPSEENGHRTIGFDISGFDINLAGPQNLTVILYKPLADGEGYSDEKYGVSYSLLITVAPERVEQISIEDLRAENPEDYKSYVAEEGGEYYYRGFEGDVLDLADLRFTLIYNSGKTEVAALSDLGVQGFGTSVETVTAGRAFKLAEKGNGSYITIDSNGVSTRINVENRGLSFKELSLTPPSKLQYTHGENFSVSGAELAVYYADEETPDGEAVRVKILGESELLPLIDLSAFDTSESKELRLTATYSDDYVEGATVAFSVWVVTTVVNLEIKTSPVSSVINGSEFPRTGSGLAVKQIFSDGSAAVEINDFSDAAWTFSPSALTLADGTALSGSVEVTVSYQGASAKFNVTVTNYFEEIVEVEFVGADNAKNFKVTEGMALDLSLYRFKVLRQDGTFAYVSANGADYDPEDMTLGERRVALYYDNSQNAPARLSIQADFEVVGKQVDKYVLSGAVEHIHTKADASFNPQGLSVKRYYDNGSYEVLTVGSEILFGGYSLEGLADADYPKVLDITLKLPNGDEIEEFEFGGNVVSSIKVTVYLKFAASSAFGDVNGNEISVPNLTLKQSSYLNGENGRLSTSANISGSGQAYDDWRAALDKLNDSYVIVTYTTGDSEKIAVKDGGFKVVGFEPMRTGTQAVSLVYADDENIKANFFVSVSPREVLLVEWANGASIGTVKEGKALEQKLLLNAKLNVVYDFGEPTVETVTAEMIRDGGKTFTPADYVGKFGDNESLTVPVKARFAGRETASSLNLVIKRKELQKIDIFGSPKTQYFEGEPFNFGATDFLKSNDGAEDLWLVLYYDNDTRIAKGDEGGVKISMSMVSWRGTYDNAEMTGQPKAQKIGISYDVDGKTYTCDYNIAMNDRANATVKYNPDNVYVYVYGESTDIGFDIDYNGTAAEYEENDVTVSFENELYSYAVSANVYTRYPINGGEGTAVKYLPAGNYTLKISYAGRAHSADCAGLNALTDRSRLVVVRKKQLAVSFDGKKISEEKIYDANTSYDADFFIEMKTFSGFVVEEGEEVLSGSPVVFADGVRLDGALKHAGSYTLKLGGFSADNYEIVYLEGSFKIAQRKIYIKLKDEGKIIVSYGESNLGLNERNGCFTVVNREGEPLSIGEPLDGELLRSQQGFNNGKEVRGNNVGRYPINLGTLSILNPDYDVKIFGDGELVFEIVRRDLTVRVNDVEAVYGATGMKLSLTYGRFYENDTAETALVGTPIYSIKNVEINGNSIVEKKDVGEYSLSVKGFSAENYNLIYEEGTFTVERKAATVLPLASQGKIYGDRDETFRYSVTGLVDGDELSGALEREAGENVGSYAFNLGTITNENNGNYDLSLSENAPKFTISEKPVVVYLSDIEKQYDGLVPNANDITKVIKDGAGNDYEKSAEVSYTLSFANAATGIGNYAITLEDTDGNHAVTLAESYSYSITPRKITVEFLTKLESETSDEDWKPFNSSNLFDYQYKNRRQMKVTYALLEKDKNNEQLKTIISEDKPLIYPTVSNGFTFDQTTQTYMVENNGRWNINVNTVADNNYTVEPTSATLNINKLELRVSATTAALTATYTAGEQLAVSEYDISASRNISEPEKNYIKSSVLSLRVGGGGQQDVVENGYAIMFVLPSDANYTAVADERVPEYRVSDYVADHGGYDPASGVLRFVVNKRTLEVELFGLEKTYDAKDAEVSADGVRLRNVEDTALKNAVLGALVYERMTDPFGNTESLDGYAPSDSGTFKVKLDNGRMTNGNYNAFFVRTSTGLQKPNNAAAEYDKDDYYVYTINKNVATVEVALNNGVRGRQYNGRALRSSDVAVNISGYYPSTLTVSEILANTGLTFGFTPLLGADEAKTEVGDYQVTIGEFFDYNHTFVMSPNYHTFTITKLTVNITVWDMFKYYDGSDADSGTTYRVYNENGVEKTETVENYKKGFDIAAQIYDENGVLRNLTHADFPDCYVEKLEGVNSGSYNYQRVFPEEKNYNFRISTSRDYEIKRAIIELGIGDGNSTYGTTFDGDFDITRFGAFKVSDETDLKNLVTFRYTDGSGNAVNLNPATPFGNYRVYPVTTAAEAKYTNYEFTVPEKHFADGEEGGFGILSVKKAKVSANLSEFLWEYRREYAGSTEAETDFAGLNMPEMFAFSFGADFELEGVDLTAIEGFVYPNFTEAFIAELKLKIAAGNVGAELTVTSSSFETETEDVAVNENYYFEITNEAKIKVSPAPLTVETVAVQTDGNFINEVSGSIKKKYGEIPTSEELGIRYSGFRGEEFEGALYFNGKWFVISENIYIEATPEQQTKIIGGSDSLLENCAELPTFFEIKKVDVYGYVTEEIGGISYKQWKVIGWEPRVELIYGFQNAGNKLAADARSFSSANYKAVAEPTFIYRVDKRSLTATLSGKGNEYLFQRTYDDYLKVGVDYFIDYVGLVNIPNIAVENAFDDYFLGRPVDKPLTDGLYVWENSQWYLCEGADAENHFVYNYEENNGFDKYYFVKDGANEYLYYIDNEGGFHSISATATVEERAQNLFYDAAPTREWFSFAGGNNKVNSSHSEKRPVVIELWGLYDNNYDITFASKGGNDYQMAIYNKIDYIMVGDSTVYATLVAEKGEESFIPIKVYYVDGTSSGIIKYYPRKAEQESGYAERIVIGDNGNYVYDPSVSGNQTLKVTYSEENPLMESGWDVKETFIVVRSYPQATVTKSGVIANYAGGQYNFGSRLKVGAKTEFNGIFAQGAYDRVDIEFVLKHSSSANGEFETVIFESGSKKLSLIARTGAGERYKLHVAETVDGVTTERDYNTYNMTESVYIDLFDGRAHLFTAFVNRLSHELVVIVDNSVIIRHSLKDDAVTDDVTGLGRVRFALEEGDAVTSLNEKVNVSFSVENLEFNVISFKASKVGYENEMSISVRPSESAPQTLYITEGNTTASVFTKSAFFTVDGSYKEGTSVEYYINGVAVPSDSLNEELPEGLYRLTARVVNSTQTNEVFSEAHFDLRIMKRAYTDGFQSDVGTPTAGSPVTLKTEGLKFHPAGTVAELSKIDIYREYGASVGKYYALLSEIGGTKYFSIINSVKNEDNGYWTGAVNYKEYNGTTDLTLSGSEISLGNNGVTSLRLDRRTSVLTLDYSVDGVARTESAPMNSVGKFYSGNAAGYGYYKSTFKIEKDSAATVDSENEYATIINLKSNDLTSNAFIATDEAYIGLSLGIKFKADGTCETVLLLKSEGETFDSLSTTDIDWLTATEEKFTVEGFFDGTNAKVSVNVYLGDVLKHKFELNRSKVSYSLSGVGIENEEVIPGWNKSDTLIKRFAKDVGGQSVILNGATLTVYGVEIGASSPIRHALYSLSRAGGSGSAATVSAAPHATEDPYTLNSSSSEVVAAMLSGGINGGYGESYNSYAVRFAFTPNGSTERKLRFILAENTSTDLTKQINAYQNDHNFTATRAVALEYIDNNGSVEMWFTFMVGGQSNVYRQLVYRINDTNDWRYLSDGEVHTVAVNFYKGARTLAKTADLVDGEISSQNVELFIDGIRYTVDGEGNYDEKGTVKRFYYPNYNTLVKWYVFDTKTDKVTTTTVGTATIDLSDKYFLDEYTSAGVAVRQGELRLYDMYVGKTAVDVAGGEKYFSQYGGLGTFFMSR